MDDPRVQKMEWARLEGARPRKAGANARLGEHGITVRPGIARITLEDGTYGFGAAGRGATREQAEALLGRPISEALVPGHGAADAWLPFEYALFDLAGKRAGLPVFRLAAQLMGRDAQSLPAPFQVPCYDTTLYFDDLHLSEEAAAAALIADEARQGYERGHRAFKIKVGRGARHLPIEEGTRRDIAIIRAVREAVGPTPPIMLDANNGYTLNLAKRVLAETADCGIFWLEEAFHEDAVLYQDLKEWLARERLSVLIADGEGQASPTLLDWARDHLVDVVQYDYLGYGFTRWLTTGAQLDTWGVRSAPHHYGGWFGNFAAGHLAGPIQRFTFIEWDEATLPACDTSAYQVQEGQVTLPETPGFGLTFDETAFARAMHSDGFRVE